MIRRVVCSLVVATVLATTAIAIEAPLPRHPAPSPDGSQIAFSWQGDLWLVSTQGGHASRLTVHPSVERFPQWSRDGRLITFVSNRHGNNDVFVMPVDRSAAPTRRRWRSQAAKSGSRSRAGSLSGVRLRPPVSRNESGQ